MKNRNPSLNFYIIYVYALIYTISRSVESANQGVSLNCTFLDIPIRKDSYAVLDVLINLRRSAPSQLGDSSLFDFSNLRVERDTELHIPAIQVVNL
jgi:hypothetical protein